MMKAKTISYLAAGVLLATAATAGSAQVSMSIGDPGFYGAISIGSAPQPVLLNPQPIVIIQPQMAMQPIYLRVRPYEQKNWRRYCRHYNACSRPVYFVDHRWYQQTYAPYYRGHRGEYNRHDNRRDDRHDNRGNNRGGQGRDQQGRGGRQ
jgi:hypothetical protein